MKWNLTLGMLALISILILAGPSGCSRVQESAPPVQTTSESVTAPLQDPAPAVTHTDPQQIAESEKYFTEGLALYEQGQYRTSVISFDEAIAADPNNYKIYTAKGIALCFAGDAQAGMTLIQKTLQMTPDYVPAFYDLAMAYKLQNDYEKSLYWFTRTIQSDPYNTWSYYGIATIYADRGDADQALIYLQKAIALDPAVKAAARRQAHFDRMRSLSDFQALVK